MPNPWDSDPIVGTGPVYGIPRTPSPQTPAQATSDELGVTQKQLDIRMAPLEEENKRVNIQQGQSSIQNQQFNQKQSLRQEFNALPITKNFGTVAQKVGTAFNAPEDPQGDLAVLYAFATVMDPNSVVRESEQEMASSTASRIAQLQNQYKAAFEGKGLPAGVREGLLKTMQQNYC